MTTLKSIALELLQKYEESETSVIWEYSGDIEKSEKYLDAEVTKYRELIDKYAGQEQNLEKIKSKLQDKIEIYVCEVEENTLIAQGMLKALGMMDEVLDNVVQEPKTGHWIFDEIDKHYYCSECKSMGVDYWDYCPNCGAKMG